MPVHPTTSSSSEGVIGTDEVCEAINALPREVRRQVASALRERAPLYPWTMSRDGRLECRCNFGWPKLSRLG